MEKSTHKLLLHVYINVSVNKAEKDVLKRNKAVFRLFTRRVKQPGYQLLFMISTDLYFAGLNKWEKLRKFVVF